MRFQIPQIKNNPSQLEQLRQSALLTTLVMNTIIAFIICVYAFVIEQPQVQKIGLFIIAAVVLLECVYKQIISELKGFQNFLLVSRSIYFRYTINFLFSIIFVYFWGFYGALAALLLSVLFTVIFLLKQYPLKLKLAYHHDLIINLIKTGAPILALEFVNITLRNIDKLLIALIMGTKALGFYAIASMLMGTLMNIPGSSREVTEQVLMVKYSELSIHQQIEEYLFKSLRFTAYFMPLLITGFYFNLPIIIELLLPEYSDALLPSQLLMVGGYFFALSYPCRGLIVANKWQKKAAIFASISVFISTILITYSLLSGYQLVSVAISSGISFLSLFIILMLFILYKFEQKLPDYSLAFLELFIPFISMLTIIFVVEHMSNWLPSHIFINSVLSYFLFIIIYFPIIYFAKKNQRISLKFSKN